MSGKPRRARPLLTVDGPRPAVEWVGLMRERFKITPDEWHVLLILALDSFDGEPSAPGYDALQSWTRLGRAQLFGVLKSLETPTAGRPALITKVPGKGRDRTAIGIREAALDEGDERPGRHSL